MPETEQPTCPICAKPTKQAGAKGGRPSFWCSPSCRILATRARSVSARWIAVLDNTHTIRDLRDLTTAMTADRTGGLGPGSPIAPVGVEPPEESATAPIEASGDESGAVRPARVPCPDCGRQLAPIGAFESQLLPDDRRYYYRLRPHKTGRGSAQCPGSISPCDKTGRPVPIGLG